MRGATALITLDNPKTRNALSSEMIVELIEALLAAGADTDCRAIVLQGAGGHFSSGGDVSGMTADRPLLGSRIRIERAHQIVRLICGGPKPVLAAVEGLAYGLGLSLATACDYVVASRDSSFCAVFNKVGLLPDMGLLATLPQRVGIVHAKQLMFTARRVKAEEALSLGIVDELADKGEALAGALEQARQMESAAPVPVALTRAFYSKGAGSLEEALRAEVDYQPALYLSEDHQEGIAAFREKREAVFRGR
jgi:enoyl-CoA hydratase/carnithine racemase